MGGLEKLVSMRGLLHGALVVLVRSKSIHLYYQSVSTCQSLEMESCRGWGGGQPSPGSCGEDSKETVLNSVPITSEGAGKERDKQDDMPWEGPAGG